MHETNSVLDRHVRGERHDRHVPPRRTPRDSDVKAGLSSRREHVVNIKTRPAEPRARSRVRVARPRRRQRRLGPGRRLCDNLRIGGGGRAGAGERDRRTGPAAGARAPAPPDAWQAAEISRRFFKSSLPAINNEGFPPAADHRRRFT
ncbi:hypothetical protein EVAR_96947_1 [Eumeta japonica]|uniref:Uncharacterized protein n=1 Tax=Eumeta variegata TaxID=151549 RepID=A0A4C1VG28_EUMVA|nr:hypothetical protein EVAR_96947_1 [Eumeta japonica]